jgi:hypothetical protein
MYSVQLKKKVDCLNFDICHRREDLTTPSIVVSQAIYKYTYMVCYTFFLKQKRCRAANTKLNHPVYVTCAALLQKEVTKIRP